MSGAPLGLFAAHGIELEYMIVDRETLDVRPLCDRVLEAVAGEIVSEVEMGEVAWSNELVLHLIELKTNGPKPRLELLPEAFAGAVAHVNRILADFAACLLPGAMHPWMDPDRETRLWPHDHGPVYATFDRIFGCRGHGWSNLQSAHLNLPFADDREFARLHAAVRLLLPLLPALAASSPVADGRIQAALDHRLVVYRSNAARVPSVSGSVVPEPVFSRRDYEEVLLGGLYRDLAPLDPDGILRHEWVNARGAIARFDRQAIEIRVLDVQECPRADLAVAALVTAATRALVEERWCRSKEQEAWPTGPLAETLGAVARDGERARLDPDYLAAFAYPGRRATAGELWRHVAGDLGATLTPWREELDVILEHGPLARRILGALGGDASRPHLAQVWGRLARCLERGEMFRA